MKKTLLIVLLLICGCSSKYYIRKTITYPNGDVIEFVEAKSNTYFTNSESANILISTSIDPNGVVSRHLEAGTLKQDISEESVKALSEGITDSIITAITKIP